MMRCPWPAEGEVHIRSFSVAADAPETLHFEHHLSQVEQVRAGRLLNDQARILFVAGRCFLRRVLGEYLGVGPECINLELSEHGKPYLAEESVAGTGLTFNMSHSGELILLAVTCGRDVGIDLEQMSGELPYREMAKIAFSSHEQSELFSLPQHLQRAAFYRCWTRKEACLKACGSGFSLPSNSFDVSLLPEDPPVLLWRRSPSAKQSVWQLFDLAVPPCYCAALAIEGAGPVHQSLM